jgi:uncharacterized protein (TIGR04255 family)
MHREIAGRYPQIEERKTIEATLQVKKPGEISAATRNLGFVGAFFKSADGHTIAQFRRDGFTLNRIGEYTSADDLFTELTDLWARYKQVARPESIASLAMRYINELSLPLRPRDDLRRFLTSAPTIPGPQGVMQFQVNLVLQDAATEGVVKVRQGLAPGPGGARYVLDIEAGFPGPLPIAIDLIAELRKLREVKNRVFFSMIEEEALEPYDRAAPPDATSTAQ